MPIIGIIASSHYTSASTFNYITSTSNGIIITSTNGTTWSFVNTLNVDLPSPNIGQRALYYVNSKFWSQPYLNSSTDGVTWTFINSPVLLQSTGSLIYAGSKYYTGTSGSLYSSTDGTTWTLVTIPTTGSSTNTKIAYGNSTYVLATLVSNALTVWTSTDATTWTSRTITSGVTVPTFNKLKFLNDKFIIVGGYTAGANSSAALIVTSTDGITWTQRTAATGTSASRIVTDIAYGNSTYVLTHQSQYGTEYSTDGITWSTGLANTASNTRTFFAVEYGAAAGFCAVPQDTVVWRSTDGITWSSSNKPTGTASTTAQSVTYDGNKYYIGTSYSTTSGSNLYTSTDLVTFTWSTTYPKASNFAVSIIKYTNNKYFATPTDSVLTLSYYNKIFTSTDTITWTSFVPDYVNSNPYSIAYGAGLYVVTGYDGAISTSTNLTTWTSRRSANGTDTQLTVNYLNNLFIAAGNTTNTNNIFTSTDGITWTTRTSGSNATINRNMIYGGNLYVALSDTIIVTSTNGTTWSTRDISSPNALYGLFYGNNIYAVTGAGGEIYTSTDTVTWTSRTSGIADALYDIYFDGSKWIAPVGGLSGYSSGKKLYITSTDTITWTTSIPQNITPPNSNLYRLMVE